MRIISHRGFWLDPLEKNGEAAFRRSVEAGFGTETDIRDLHAHLVISHDPPLADAMPFHRFLGFFASTRLPLALNVKADGLAALIGQAMANYRGDWFAFDMSGPETVRYLDLGLPVFTRHSDIEIDPICYESVSGIWLDAFRFDWFGADEVYRHLERGKRVVIVSPELHRRDPNAVWSWLLASGLCRSPDVTLCTDYPSKAKAYFHSDREMA